MDHRVEPPAWLPQGAAPEAVDPEADDSIAAEDEQQAEDSNDAPAEAEEFANGNGHDSSFSYSNDDSYHYGGELAVRRRHQLPKPVYAAQAGRYQL